MGKAQQSNVRAESGKVLLFAKVVASVVGGNPVAEGIDFEHQLLGRAGLDQKQVAFGDKAFQQFKLRVVELEDFRVELAVNVWVGEKGRRAAILLSMRPIATW